jgi:hypothetical protein
MASSKHFKDFWRLQSLFNLREVNFARVLWVLMRLIMIPEGRMASHLMEILCGLAFIFVGGTFVHADRAY